MLCLNELHTGWSRCDTYWQTLGSKEARDRAERLSPRKKHGGVLLDPSGRTPLQPAPPQRSGRFSERRCSRAGRTLALAGKSARRQSFDRSPRRRSFDKFTSRERRRSFDRLAAKRRPSSATSKRKDRHLTLEEALQAMAPAGPKADSSSSSDSDKDSVDTAELLGEEKPKPVQPKSKRRSMWAVVREKNVNLRDAGDWARHEERLKAAVAATPDKKSAKPAEQSATSALTQPAVLKKVIESKEVRLPHRLRSDGARSLCRSLKNAVAPGGALEGSGLKTVDVRWNSLEPDAVALCASLAALPNAKCKSLALSGNAMDGTSCLELARGLAKQDASLKALELRQCDLDDEALLALLEQLAGRNKSLLSLDVAENRVGNLSRAVRAGRARARRTSMVPMVQGAMRRHAPVKPTVQGGLSPLLSVLRDEHQKGKPVASGLSAAGAVARAHQIVEAKAVADGGAHAARHRGALEPLANFVSTWHERRFGGGGGSSATSSRKQRELLQLLLGALEEAEAPGAAPAGDPARRVRQLVDVLGLSPARARLYAPAVGDQLVLMLARAFRPTGVSHALDACSSVSTEAMLQAVIGADANVEVPATWDAPWLLPLASDAQLLELVENLESLGRRRKHHVPLDDFLDEVLAFVFRQADIVQRELRDAFGDLGIGSTAELGWDAFVDLVDYFRAGLTQARTVDLYEEITTAGGATAHGELTPDQAVEAGRRSTSTGPVVVGVDRLVRAFWKAGCFRAREHSSGFEVASRLLKAGGPPSPSRRKKYVADSDDSEDESGPHGAPVAGVTTPWRLSLTSLNLSANALSAPGELATLLGATPLLKELDLARNPLGDAGAVAVAAACDRCAHQGAPRKLKRLGLAACGIGARGALALADVVKARLNVTPKLEEIVLDANPLAEAGCRALLRAVTAEDHAGVTSYKLIIGKSEKVEVVADLKVSFRDCDVSLLPHTQKDLREAFPDDIPALAFSDPEDPRDPPVVLDLDLFEHRAAARRAASIVARRSGRWFERLAWRAKNSPWLDVELRRFVPGVTARARLKADAEVGHTRAVFDARRSTARPSRVHQNTARESPVLEWRNGEREGAWQVPRGGELEVVIGYAPRLATTLACATSRGLRALRNTLRAAGDEREALAHLAVSDCYFTVPQACDALCGFYYAGGRPDDDRCDAASAALLKRCTRANADPSCLDDDDDAALPATPEIARFVAALVPRIVDRSKVGAFARACLPGPRAGRRLRSQLGLAFGPCVGAPNGRYPLRLWRGEDRLALRMLLELDDAERRELRARRGLARFGKVAEETADTNLRLVKALAAPAGTLDVPTLSGSVKKATILETRDRDKLIAALLSARDAADTRETKFQSILESAGNVLVHLDYASTTRPREGVDPLDAEGVLALMANASVPAPHMEMKRAFLRDESCVLAHAALRDERAKTRDPPPAPPWVMWRVDADRQVASVTVTNLFRVVACRGRAKRRKFQSDVEKLAPLEKRGSMRRKKAKKKAQREAEEREKALLQLQAEAQSAWAPRDKPLTSEELAGRRWRAKPPERPTNRPSEVFGPPVEEDDPLDELKFHCAGRCLSVHGLALIVAHYAGSGTGKRQTRGDYTDEEFSDEDSEDSEAEAPIVETDEVAPFAADGLRTLDAKKATECLTALAPHAEDLEEVADLLLSRLDSKVVAELAERLGVLNVLRPPRSGSSRSGFAPERLRLDLKDPDMAAAAVAVWTLASREGGDAALDRPQLRDSTEWKDAKTLVHADPQQAVAGPPPKTVEVVLESYRALSRDAALRARAGRHLFLCRAHKARAPLEAREAALHAASGPHERRWKEELPRATGWTHVEQAVAKQAPAAAGFVVALHWAQTAAFARAALFLQAACKKIYDKRAAKALAKEETKEEEAPAGLSPVVGAFEEVARGKHGPKRLGCEAAVRVLNEVLKSKAHADAHAEDRRQAKMPLAHFLLKWHTMRWLPARFYGRPIPRQKGATVKTRRWYGAGYSADQERAQLLAFLRDFSEAMAADGWSDVRTEEEALAHHNHDPRLRHVMAPRARQCCALLGVAPGTAHLYSPLLGEQYVLLLRRLGTAGDLARALGYEVTADSERGNVVDLDVALHAVTGGGHHQDAAGVEAGGVQQDCPATWDARVLGVFTFD